MDDIELFLLNGHFWIRIDQWLFILYWVYFVINCKYGVVTYTFVLIMDTYYTQYILQ